MLKTFALRGREVPITIYGPPGLSDLFVALRRIFGKLTFGYTLEELPPGAVLAREDYRIETFSVRHGVSAVGYAIVEEQRPGRFDVDAAATLGIPVGPERGTLQRGESVQLSDGRVIQPSDVLGPARPGRKIVFAGDGAPAPTVIDAARGADLLVHEATFCADEEERARETLHATAAEAAIVAREAGVTLLALTHLSSRYFGGEVKREAQEVFPETVVPRDFDTIEIPFAERGTPRLVRGGALPERHADAAGRQPVTTLEEGSR
jgi:ribonuclease Z